MLITATMGTITGIGWDLVGANSCAKHTGSFNLLGGPLR